MSLFTMGSSKVPKPLISTAEDTPSAEEREPSPMNLVFTVSLRVLTSEVVKVNCALAPFASRTGFSTAAT